MDLAPYLDVNLDLIIANVRQMNPRATIIPVSAKSGEGLERWFGWLREQITSSAVPPTAH